MLKWLQGARLREKSERVAAGDDISESSDESEIDEELGYISPLDIVDPYVSFKQALTSMFDFVSFPRIALIFFL